jgi:hypothetical protein
MVLKPHFIIGPPTDPYLYRWYIIPRNPWLNIYLHQFWKSDDDRALHDHPWWNLSFILKGGYWEHLPTYKIWRKPFKFYFRKAVIAHRIEIEDHSKGSIWSLFITGSWKRPWGFHCPKGWVYWKDFVSTYEGGNLIGKGCNQ